MTTFRASGRYLIGWFVVAMAAIGQAPRLYGDGDPSCPTCSEKGVMAAHDVPLLGLAPHHVPSPVVVPQIETPLEAPCDDAPAPMVRLRTRVPACAEVGKELEYRIKVENTSPADAHNVVVRMSLPASVKVLRTSPQAHARDPELQWNLGTMPGHGCHDIVVVVVPLGLADIKSCMRVTFEHGQCVTTKVMAFAPEGSADGKTPAGVYPGGPFGPGGMGGTAPGGAGLRTPFDVRVFGPAEAVLGQEVDYKITIFNTSDQPLYNVIADLNWNNELEVVKQSEEFADQLGIKAWPKPPLAIMPAKSSKSLVLTMRTKAPAASGRYCVRASAIASQTPVGGKDVSVKDEACTEFHRPEGAMTLEMFDRDDPILKNGQTSYPITVRNQGKDPITNLRIKARVPDLLELVQVITTGKFESGPKANREYWVEFEPVAKLNGGETRTFEIAVKGKGMVGDARFHVEMTADQLDKGNNGAERWIIEEESTTLVPDEETRARIAVSRKTGQKVSRTVTSDR